MTDDTYKLMRERRKYRQFAPIFFMGLELIGVFEIILIGYSVFMGNIIYLLVAFTLALILTTISYHKMKMVYHRSYQLMRQTNIAMQSTLLQKSL